MVDLIRFVLGDRIIEEVGLRMLDHSYVLLTVLLVLAKDEDPVVAKNAISVGTAFYCTILEEMAMQVRTCFSSWMCCIKHMLF